MKRGAAALKKLPCFALAGGGGTWFALQGGELNDTLNKFFWGKIYETQLRCSQKN